MSEGTFSDVHGISLYWLLVAPVMFMIALKLVQYLLNTIGTWPFLRGSVQGFIAAFLSCVGPVRIRSCKS